jgi:hypothetical protein
MVVMGLDVVVMPVILAMLESQVEESWSEAGQKQKCKTLPEKRLK